MLWLDNVTEFKEDINVVKRYDKQFRQDAVRYFEEHKELCLRECAENLGIATSTLGKWIKEHENTIDNKSLTSGNDCLNKCPEVKRLKSEVDVLKKAICILGQ